MLKEINDIRRNRKALVNSRRFLDNLTRNGDFFLNLYKFNPAVANSVEDTTTVKEVDANDHTLVFSEGTPIHERANNGWSAYSEVEYDAETDVLTLYAVN